MPTSFIPAPVASKKKKAREDIIDDKSTTDVTKTAVAKWYRGFEQEAHLDVLLSAQVDHATTPLVNASRKTPATSARLHEHLQPVGVRIPHLQNHRLG